MNDHSNSLGKDPSFAKFLGTPWGTCLFCGRQCRVPLSQGMPQAVQDGYKAAGLSQMATCDPGAAAEKTELGVSYSDVIDARMRQVQTSQNKVLPS